MEQKSPGTWTFRVELPHDATGARRQKRVTVKGTKREAEAEQARLIHELARGTYREPSRITFGEFLAQWVEGTARTTVAPKTLERYQQLIRVNITPAIGHIPIGKLRPQELQAFYGRLASSGRLDGRGGLAPATIRQIHAIIHRALRQALRWEFVSRNVAEMVDVPRIPRKEAQALDQAGVAILIKESENSPYHLPILLALTTGLRRGELLALTWDNVELEHSRLRVTRSIQVTKAGMEVKEPKSPRSRRLVTLPALAVQALGRERTRQSDRQYDLGVGYNEQNLVICQEDGSSVNPDHFSGSFKRWLSRRPHLPQVRFHDLRHSHATLLLAVGEHPKVVSERLGHSTIAVTMDVYSHVLPGLQEQVASRLDLSLRAALAANPASRPSRATGSR